MPVRSAHDRPAAFALPSAARHPDVMKPGRSALNFVGGLSDRLMTRIPSFMLQASTLSREAYLRRLAFYAEWPQGKEFFELPSEAPACDVLQQKPMAAAERILYRYPSRYSARNPELAESLAAHPNNQQGYLHLWRHQGESARRPLVLCVHGFGMAGPYRAEQMFKIERMHALGLDVALHHLPHHWRRSDRPPNNELLRPQDVPLTLEEWARNLHDLHSAVLFVRQLGYGRIGLIGASLGGLTGLLYATTDSATGTERPLDFIFAAVPAVDLSGFLRPRPGRMAFKPDGQVRELSTRALQRIVPSSYPPRFDVERIGIVAHQGDRVCPIGPTRQLVARWGISHHTEVVGGHWIYLDQKARGRAWYGWLQRHGYL